MTAQFDYDVFISHSPTNAQRRFIPWLIEDYKLPDGIAPFV